MKYVKLFAVESMVSQSFGVTPYAASNPNYAVDNMGNRYHEGLDLYPKGRTDWRLYAFTGGRVMWAGWGEIYGWNLILFDERHRMSYRFCHLEVLAVEEGDKISAGHHLGFAGNSGASDGPHLHLNAVPMTQWGKRMCEWNNRKGRVDPLGILVDKGVHI